MKTSLEVAKESMDYALHEWQHAKRVVVMAEAKCDRCYDILCKETAAAEEVTR